MRINTKVRYGLRTIMEIAISTDPNGIFQKDISTNQNISLKYLDSIIMSLKLAGLVANTKGKGSGYKLTRDPSEITMWDVYTAFEPLIIVDCINGNGICNRTINCKAKTYWCDFKEDFKDILLKKKLSEIISNN